jgi:hypothetical protein
MKIRNASASFLPAIVLVAAGCANNQYQEVSQPVNGVDATKRMNPVSFAVYVTGGQATPEQMARLEALHADAKKNGTDAFAKAGVPLPEPVRRVRLSSAERQHGER